MMKTLLRLTAVLAVVACLVIWASLRSFRVFLEEDLVAVVRCETAPDGVSYSFLIQVTPVVDGRPLQSEKFPMIGDQWAVGGDFLKWHSWLNLMGLRNRHKLTRLSSRYWTALDEMYKPRIAYDLNGGSFPPWRWLYRYGIQLPFVDAVYSTTAYVPARPGEQWGVYVGQTGYLLRPLERRA